MSEHVLLVSLGPIQDFIASARRCQDLWFGSWLLSDLARVAARAISESAGDDDALVFPASLDVGETEGVKPAVANKILALLKNGVSPARTADAGREAMSKRLNALASDAFSHVGLRDADRGKGLPDHFPPALRERALLQVNELIEYVWVAFPFDGSAPGNYAEARTGAERLLSARKNRRSWGSVKLARSGGWGDTVPKSSLDGLRESVLHEALFDTRQRGERGRTSLPTPQQTRERYFVKGCERLCGVGLFKRVGSEVEFSAASCVRSRPGFHSTSHVASAPLRTRIARLSKEQALASYLHALETSMDPGSARRLRVSGEPTVCPVESPYSKTTDGRSASTPSSLGEQRFDGRVLYEGQLPALMDETSGAFSGLDPKKNRPQRDALLRPVRDALHTLLREVSLPIDGVPTYYATLLADGDNMGAALERVGSTKGIDGHRHVARALDAFAMRCRGITQAHAGSLIYSGGDDVLALVPLHTALACARRLHDVFGELIGGALRELGCDGAAPTLSVGLGIGHHLEDMADVRELAKQAERKAKGQTGKDALAVVVQMRSGGRLEAVGGWSGTAARALDRRIAEWARLQLLEEIPGKAAHELEAEMAPLLMAPSLRRDADGKLPNDLSGVAKSLLVRVLDRRRGGAGSERLSKTVRELVDHALTRPDDPNFELAKAVHALSEELQIARLFADAYRVAFELPPVEN